MKKSSKTFKCSDPSQNVYGFSVDTAGIKLESFSQNPVCLLNHNYDKVMGSWTDVAVVGTTLQGVPIFDDEDTEGAKYYGQVERDVIKGASIGIIPLSVEGDVITSCDLLEISITPVPANRNALVIYNAKGVALNAKEAKAYMLSVQTDPNKPEEDKNKQLKTMNKELLAALVLLCAQAGVTVQLSADSKDEDIQKAMTNIGNKVTALSASNIALKTANDEFATQALNAKNAEVTELVDAAVADKRITAEKRESFVKLAAADMDLFKSTLESLKPVTLSVVPGAGVVADAADRANWSFDDYLQKDSAALSAMQINDVEKFNTLYSAKKAALKAKGAIA